MKYLVTEIQTFDNNTIGTLTWDFDDRNTAESKYHALMSVAATSTLPAHTAMLITNEGLTLLHGCYKHEAST